jgi:hypothetical protein
VAVINGLEVEVDDVDGVDPKLKAYNPEPLEHIKSIEAKHYGTKQVWQGSVVHLSLKSSRFNGWDKTPIKTKGKQSPLLSDWFLKKTNATIIGYNRFSRPTKLGRYETDQNTGQRPK